jgi:hypothetical protein
MLRPLSRRGVTGTLTLRPFRARLPRPVLLRLPLLLPLTNALLALAQPGGMRAGEVDVDDELANPTGDGSTSGDDGLDEGVCADADDASDDENNDGDAEADIGANTEAAAAAATAARYG